MTEQAPGPGWYPDPAGTGGTRWWTGVGWAADVPGYRSVDDSPVLVSGVMAPTAKDTQYVPFGTHDQTDSFRTETSLPASPLSVEQPTNRLAVASVVMGLSAVGAVIGAYALGYPAVWVLVPAAISLGCAIVAFRRGRRNGARPLVALIAVVLALGATVVTGFPFVADLMGLGPSAASEFDGLLGFKDKVQTTLMVTSSGDFGSAAQSVSCPDDMVPLPGSKFSCTEHLTDGRDVVVVITVDGSADGFTHTQVG